MINKTKKIKVLVLLSRSGFILILIIGAMFIASMNYSNNMAYSMCFILLSLMVVAFIYTGNNLKGLEVSNIQAKIAFAEGHASFSLEIENNSSRERAALFIQAKNPIKSEFFGPFSVDCHNSKVVEISLPSPKRGQFVLSRISLISVYPLGLFRGSTRCYVQKEYIVFPKPSGFRPWPTAITQHKESDEGYHFSGGEDFAGLRPYRTGESQHHIDWKAYARGRPLCIKEFTGGGSLQQWFDWNSLSGLGTEARISQLTKWVLDADKLGNEFGLKLLDIEIKPDVGTRHTFKCLKTLALFFYKQ